MKNVILVSTRELTMHIITVAAVSLCLHYESMFSEAGQARIAQTAPEPAQSASEDSK